MFLGHFALALALKAKYRFVPLIYLILGVQMLDLLFIPLAFAGIETTLPAYAGSEAKFGGLIIHADYTHSLLGVVLISLVVAGLMSLKGRKFVVPMAIAVSSHWLIDLIVHRPDLPILPGDRSIQLGFGLWEIPLAAWILEVIFIIGFWSIYMRAAKQTLGEEGSPRRLPKGVYAILILFLAVQLFFFPT